MSPIQDLPARPRELAPGVRMSPLLAHDATEEVAESVRNALCVPVG